MTQITNLYIGNRHSGKTQKLIDELSYNLLHDPHTRNIIFSSNLKKPDVLKRLPDFRNPKITVTEYRVEALLAINSPHIYLDELELADRKNSYDLVNNLSIARPKSVHVNTTPLFLRDSKDLNVNHTQTRDPLIKVLQLTDFEFDFLFSEETADKYYNIFLNNNRDLFYTEGLGMLSLFD